MLGALCVMATVWLARELLADFLCSASRAGRRTLSHYTRWVLLIYVSCTLCVPPQLTCPSPHLWRLCIGWICAGRKHDERAPRNFASGLVQPRRRSWSCRLHSIVPHVVRPWPPSRPQQRGRI